MNEYVLVLPLGYDVLLVLKDRPEWQKGKLNILGGKIEPGETPTQAAVRELKEESGLIADTLEICGKLCGDNYVVYCLNCKIIDNIVKPREGETEYVNWYSWNKVINDPRLIPNLKVIIPLLMMNVHGWTIIDDVTSHKFTIELNEKQIN